MTPKSLLPYDMSRGGQVIEVLDLSVFQVNRSVKLDHYIKAKSEVLQKQYKEMVELWEWNNYVDQFKVNFEPVIGKTYYLYEGTTKFISILSPEELKTCKFLGSVTLCSDGYWVNNDK
jgi:hypothetical protein